MEGSTRGVIEVVSRNLRGGTEENHEKYGRIGGVPAEIQTDNLANTSV
jgi:hypothetical protein